MTIEIRKNAFSVEEAKQGLLQFREVLHPDNVGRRIAFIEAHRLFPNRVKNPEDLKQLPREVRKPMGTMIGRFVSTLDGEQYNKIAADTYIQANEMLEIPVE